MKIQVLFFFLFFSTGFYAQKFPVKPDKQTATNQPIKLKNFVDSIQYSLGIYVAQLITNNGFIISNPDLFIKGMDDVFGRSSLLIADSTVAPLLNNYLQINRKAKAANLEQQLFASLKDKPGIGLFPNGVRYAILKAGKGPRPYEKDSISINLIAKLPDGTVVEDTYQTKKPFAATPTSFFPGLNETLLEMGEGAKWTIYVPSVLAYGEKGTTLIPPNSALILEVELLEVRSAKK